ncbi:MAG: hypothetical protein WAL25_09545 [Acidimicrobiia bacterium]
MADREETLYREGVQRWADRDIPAAIELLSTVVDEGTAESQGWWHAASRALAQIAFEADDPDAGDYLGTPQGSGVGDAQTLALSARRFYQAGDEEAAIAEIHEAAMRMSKDPSGDVGSLMNGAMAMIWCSDVLAELGFAGDASALVIRARMRMAAAGVADPVLDAMATMVEASIARLACNPESSLHFLAKVDDSLSPDLMIKVTRERARIADDADRDDEAGTLYRQALQTSRDTGYAFLERSIAVEMTEGPPVARHDRAPVGQWDPRAEETVPEGHLPYALVIRLRIEDESAIYDLEDRISDLLRDRPDLGYVDGNGTDGDFWEIFLDGDDPDRLWDEVRPLLASPILWRNTEVSKRHGSGSSRFRLDSSDF